MSQFINRTAEAERLLTDPKARAGLSYSQMKQAGLTDLEAATAASGFSGSFGSGNARAYRETMGYNDPNALVQSQANPTIQQHMQNQVMNPQLAAGTEIIPQTMGVQQGETIDPRQFQTTFTPIQAPTQIQAPTIQGTQAGYVGDVDLSGVQIDPNAGQMQATYTTDVGQMEAAQGQVRPEATVRGQLESLYADMEEGTPAWAQGSVNAAEEMLAARGLGASSIAGGAITQAIQQNATQIAAADAQTYFQMDLTNLNNQQQANLVNFQTKQQNMLTDVGIANATAQFNAANELQVQQFTSQLVTQVKMQNQSLKQNVENFNASQANQIEATNAGNEIAVARFNTEMQVQVEQYNANMDAQRQQFNANMGAQIEQSNVQWRRQINTANTAAINASIQTNAQNRFNLSNQATSNLWNAVRDELAWAFQASENQKARDQQLLMASTNYQFQQKLQPGASELFGSSLIKLGSAGELKNTVNDIGSAITDVFKWIK